MHVFVYIFFKISDQNISLFEESEQNNLSALAMDLIVSVLRLNVPVESMYSIAPSTLSLMRLLF